MSDNTNLLWIDLETTGLVASTEVPLELGLILTDKWGEELAAESWLIYEDDNMHFLDCIDNAVPFVKEMHTKSGLWTDLQSQHYWTRDNLDRAACRWLQDLGVESGVLPMTGSSIGSLDRPFVQHHLPNLNKYFNYRNVDISSIKEICDRVNPALMAQLKPFTGGKEDSEHRVLADARASIYEYILYIENFLITED